MYDTNHVETASKNVNKYLKKLADKFAALVVKQFKGNIVSIVLFGSVAREEAGAHSDIDLVLIFKNLPNGRLTRTKLLEPIEDAMLKDLEILKEKGIFTNFNCLLKTQKEALHTRPLYLDLTQDAVYLYDNEKFFRNIISDFSKKLQRLGSERRKVGSLTYWELKPDFKPGEVFEI